MRIPWWGGGAGFQRVYLMPEKMATGCQLPFSKFIIAAASVTRKPLYAFYMGKSSISQSALAFRSNSGKSPLGGDKEVIVSK